MIDALEQLKQWLEAIALAVDKEQDPSQEYYLRFVQNPEIASSIIALMQATSHERVEDNQSWYSACLYAFDICIAQLQASHESGNKQSGRLQTLIMQQLASAIETRKHALNYWLPVLNAFYDVHVELSEELKNAYLDLASEEEELVLDTELTRLETMRDLIQELSDQSVFDIAENFFAQSHMMPADFFIDLLADLYSIEEGHDIGLLALLHPDSVVRDIVVTTLDVILPSIQLSSQSLSRLQAIKNWYPASYHGQFDQWIKQQRKQGVVFSLEPPAFIKTIKASEVDGSGAQGLFIHVRHHRKHQLCGLLFKQSIGIKDAWITPVLSASDVAHYYDEAFDGNVTLNSVTLDYAIQMINHFLALTLESGAMPDLHLLEMQEVLGLRFIPERLDINYLMDQLGVQITPFTQATLTLAMKRSGLWLKNKPYTTSWFLENSNVDRWVNRSCSYKDDVKVCQFDDAMQLVFEHEMEPHREQWLFHFIWVALWSKSKSRRNETFWKDSFMIAYAIHQGVALSTLPIMQSICHRTVVNSLETMQERRSHLNQE